jgi:hypothetical protein
VDSRLLRSKIAEQQKTFEEDQAKTKKALEEAQNEVKRLKSEISTFSPVPAETSHTTNEVFFIRPMHSIQPKHSTDYDPDLVSKGLGRICPRLGLTLIDPKESKDPGDILAAIVDYLKRSRLVVADVSEISNASVYYEVGFVYGSFPKKLILVAHQSVLEAHWNTPGKQLPFNISTQRVLPYGTNAWQFQEFQDQLELVMKGMLEEKTPR